MWLDLRYSRLCSTAVPRWQLSAEGDRILLKIKQALQKEASEVNVLKLKIQALRTKSYLRIHYVPT